MSNETSPRSSAGLAWFAGLYALFIVYGSLLPFDYRPGSMDAAREAFANIPYLQLGVASRADWVANILLYVPLAFAAMGAAAQGLRHPVAAALGALLVAAVCVALAVGVEFAQLFFPPRTVSQNDLIAETLGTGLGIVAWFVGGPRLMHIVRSVAMGRDTAWHAGFVLYLLAYGALSFFPYDLLVSTKELSDKLADPTRSAWLLSGSCGGVVGCSVKLGAEVALAAPLGALLGFVFHTMRVPTAFAVGMVAGAAIELVQLGLASGVSQGLSVFTRAAGVAWGLVLQRSLRGSVLQRHHASIRICLVLGAPLYLVLLAVLNGFAGRLEPQWVANDKLAATHFLPFYYHYYTTETEAMWSLLANAGAYAVIGIALWLLRPSQNRAWAAGGLAALAALGIEILKLYLPDKRPDPTNVLIGFAAAWLVNATLVRLGRRPGIEVESPQRGQRSSARRTLVWGGGASALMLASVAALVASPHAEKAADESGMAQLPPGHELPAVSLPGFKQAHPRLPHPTAADVARLLAEGNAYLGEMRRLAKSAQPRSNSYHARAVVEFIEPGSQDLSVLHGQLMTTRFEWRGHDQVRPLAVAYDWLHDRWTVEQRTQLRSKLAEGCEYLVQVIRTERLSPYNVFLYNAPFQALVACALALYGDDVRGESVMRFTHDLWKQRVLPVWRQIMGRHGGWHEGGEYVGIGIGQAVYQVPAMWRAATGEDLFASEPGLRGFLDFAVQRTRPDGTHVRIGDGSFFDRGIPDLVPLAIEYGHAAAYSLNPPKRIGPTAWPWGPLPDTRLNDPQARERLPRSQWFDGIGWAFARSSWAPESTYVTFKAGDNFWSHTHLDQGSFTIYKGGALALDSGANYGTRYGSDHHLNYSYQTIAHNTITVTDPDDTVPMPNKPREPVRVIANDGGQRRIGSGWGVEPAPLDLAEWERKGDIYRTGRILRHTYQDGITLVVSDVTAAYTNELSGEGTFSHRTRRVERAWRIFAFDEVDEVVVVYDEVVATRPEFRKRWMLHTPFGLRIDGRRFVTDIPPGKGTGRAGGRLEGQVLLPKSASLLAVGGRGFEFFVDGVNFDEGGKLLEAIENSPPQRSEPGRWRLEVLPPTDAETDRFLVALMPTTWGRTAPHQVTLLEEGGRTGAEVSGPNRTVRYWFTGGKLEAVVSVERKVPVGNAIGE